MNGIYKDCDDWNVWKLQLCDIKLYIIVEIGKDYITININN